ncbi:hypothetical protein M408DRAFT_156380 [Serendipita vermifera MAFF 305830]|uniref:SPX domain-containing protein n=1 Tax=Serendipita vermifera MAFF 305830 TaxID=933852 RepID=A0A0C3BN62_SERVB|nr:hypothetical protein M408DRAFT_156380 [Serendipita vermifera MAFF 305830]
MKFGKRILSERIPGWQEYYLDYKALKKIVSSVTADHSPTLHASNDPHAQTASMAPSDVFQRTSVPVQPLWELSSPLGDNASPLSTIAASTSMDGTRGPAFQMKKAAFFFKLQRELDKVGVSRNFLVIQNLTLSHD